MIINHSSYNNSGNDKGDIISNVVKAMARKSILMQITARGRMVNTSH
jgi:hypothetical protein